MRGISSTYHVLVNMPLPSGTDLLPSELVDPQPGVVARHHHPQAGNNKHNYLDARG